MFFVERANVAVTLPMSKMVYDLPRNLWNGENDALHKYLVSEFDS